MSKESIDIMRSYNKDLIQKLYEIVDNTFSLSKLTEIEKLIQRTITEMES